MTNEEIYLRAILATVARQTFPVVLLEKLVAPKKGLEKQVAAYNLCDGTRTAAEIARELGLDTGNFSKTVGRWLELGILIRVGEGKENRPLHVYPLPADLGKGEKRSARDKRGADAPETGDAREIAGVRADKPL